MPEIAGPVPKTDAQKSKIQAFHVGSRDPMTEAISAVPTEVRHGNRRQDTNVGLQHLYICKGHKPVLC